MAVIHRGNSKIALGAGSTWGTAATLTNRVPGRFTLGGSVGRFNSRDVGFGNVLKEIIKLQESVEVSFTHDMAYNNRNFALAHFMGTDTTSVSDVTAYEHILDADSENDAEFCTMAWKVETDRALEIPSIKYNSLRIAQQANGIGEVTVGGIGDRLVYTSPENTASDIDGFNLNGGTTQYQAAKLGGANHYFRINSHGGGALSSGDDECILGYELNITRPVESDFCLRGANTQYTVEPLVGGGLMLGTLRVDFPDVDDSILDDLAAQDAGTQYKIEIFMDGDSITGSSTNASIKLQFPLVQIVDRPTGYDLPDNTGRMRRSITFDLLSPDSAPTGMTGRTDIFHWVGISDATGAFV